MSISERKQSTVLKPSTTDKGLRHSLYVGIKNNYQRICYMLYNTGKGVGINTVPACK